MRGTVQSTTQVLLIRHGETEWSRTHRHTGLTDIELTATGERQAVALGAKIAAFELAEIWTSPLRRAVQTCRLAGLGDRAVVHDDLVEWDYGEFEGSVTAHHRVHDPAWSIWTAPIHEGETLAAVGERADAVVDRLVVVGGSVALFAHGQFLRVLAARWIGAPPRTGRHLVLGPATVSMLGMDRGDRVIERWNEACHPPGEPDEAIG